MSNNSTNSTVDFEVFGGEPNPIISPPMVVLLCIVYSAVLLVGSCTNSLVIYTIVNRSRRAAGDVFIIGLASVDFLASVFVPINMIPDIITHLKNWYYGNIGCKVLPVISPASIFASSWILVAIAVDRYR